MHQNKKLNNFLGLNRKPQKYYKITDNIGSIFIKYNI